MKYHEACILVMIWPWEQFQGKIKIKIMTCLQYYFLSGDCYYDLVLGAIPSHIL